METRQLAKQLGVTEYSLKLKALAAGVEDDSYEGNGIYVFKYSGRGTVTLENGTTWKVFGMPSRGGIDYLSKQGGIRWEEQ